MNRRNFLKTLVSGVLGLAVAPKITLIFDELISIGPVGEFEFYYIIHTKLYIYNPGVCAYIDNIQIPEGY